MISGPFHRAGIGADRCVHSEFSITCLSERDCPIPGGINFVAVIPSCLDFGGYKRFTANVKTYKLKNRKRRCRLYPREVKFSGTSANRKQIGSLTVDSLPTSC